MYIFTGWKTQIFLVIGKTPNEGHNQIYFEPTEQFALGIAERSISATA